MNLCCVCATRACYQILRFFVIRLLKFIKIYLIGSFVPVFENRKKCFIITPPQCTEGCIKFLPTQKNFISTEKIKKKLSRKYPIQGQTINLCIHIYKEFFNYVEWNFMSTFLAKISINIHMNLILNRSLSIVPTMFCLQYRQFSV